jgi:signal transduction histidine kinase
MTTVRRLLGERWLSLTIRVVVLELIVVGGTFGDRFVAAGARSLDAFAVALLVLIAAAAGGLAARRPLIGFGVVLALTAIYAGAGYNTHGPIILAIGVALYFVPTTEHVLRSAVLGAVTAVVFGAATAVASGIGDFIPATAATIPMVVAALGIGHAVAFNRLRTAEAKEAEAQRRLTEERLRIARELHDVVSHSISVINVQAGVAAHVIDDQPEKAREALLAIKTTSKEALRELRGILGVLREEATGETTAPAPGLAQLPLLIDTSMRAGVSTRLDISGVARPLAPAVDLAAYRIIQESLTNVLRHAGPASADVKVAYEDQRVVIEVTDDGNGGSNGHRESGGAGLGIAGMRERVAAVGGELETGPRLGRGFRVRASLPMEVGPA